MDPKALIIIIIEPRPLLHYYLYTCYRFVIRFSMRSQLQVVVELAQVSCRAILIAPVM